MDLRVGPALCAFVILAMPASALATHTAGVTYKGDVTEFGATEDIGDVEIDISADGANVTRFALTDVNPGASFPDACVFTQVWTDPVPITGDTPDYHRFSTIDTGNDVFEFDGYATDGGGPGVMDGRAYYTDTSTDSPVCGSEVSMEWSAQLPGGCEGTAEYMALKEKFAELQKKRRALTAKFESLRAKRDRADANGNVPTRLINKIRRVRRKLRNTIRKQNDVRTEAFYLCNTGDMPKKWRP